MEFTVDSILVFGGILIMIYATYKGYLLYKLFASPTAWYSMGGELTRTWRILLTLIVFFLLAYIGYFILQLSTAVDSDSAILVSAVFLFGAVFVLMVVNLSYATYSRFASKQPAAREEKKGGGLGKLFGRLNTSHSHEDTEHIPDAGPQS